MRHPRGSFLSMLAGPLALQELSLQHLIAQAKHSQQSADDRAAEDACLPTVDDVIAGDRVAVIPLHGLMLKRSQVWEGWYSSEVFIGSDHWATVIDDLRNRLDIETIVLDCDSPGGEVAGTERLGEAVWQARQAGKNVIAVVNELCGSANLWVATQAGRIVVPKTGTIGSLGVYRVHMDDTKALNDFGIEVNVIHRGKYKARESRPLDADGRADLQRYIDEKYSLFVDAVARGRGLPAEQVMERWGDSSIYSGTEAVSSGLADEIGTLQDVLDSLRAGRFGRCSIDTPATPEEDPEMSLKLNAQGQILAADGKPVGALSDLSLDAAALTKHFAPQTSELIDSAVNVAKAAAAETARADIAAAAKSANERLDALVAAVGAEKAVEAFKAGKTVEAAKAELADDLKQQLAAKDKELAELKAKAPAAATPAPKFSATDDKGQGNGKQQAKAEDPDSEYADAFEKDGAGFPSLKAFACYQRLQSRKTAKV